LLRVVIIGLGKWAQSTQFLSKLSFSGHYLNVR